MLSGQAYTFGKKARLAVSLAWVGGFVDAVGFCELSIYTSNMTGNTAMIGLRVGESAWTNALYVYILVTAFLAGAMLAGVLIESARRAHQSYVYTIALAIEAALLVATVAYHRAGGNSVYLRGVLPCIAMGLQNATITRISGSVVRTTHVTGIVTDLGLETIQFLFWLRDKSRWKLAARLHRPEGMLRVARATQRHPTFQRLVLLAGIWTTFVTGAALGAYLWHRWGVAAFLLPSIFLLVVIVLERITPLATVHAMDRAARARLFLAYGLEPDLVPESVGIYALSGSQGSRRLRPPDLGELHEHIRPGERVIILMLPAHVDINENALAGLRASIHRLREHQPRRELILCTSDATTFHTLTHSELVQDLDAKNLCSDPEFAVARALDYLVSAT